MSRILIIEDELDIANLEKDYLELSGFEVDIETDGTAGLAVHLVHTGVFPHGSLVGGNGRGRGQTDE